MPKPYIHSLFTRTAISVLVAVFSTFSIAPAMQAYADCPTPDPSSQPGVHTPTGSDASLYHYDCASGMWLSSHYTFNPSTGAYTANDPIYYTYNPSTQKYDFTAWIYNAPSGDYIQVTQSVATPPPGATVVGSPAPATSSTGNGTTPAISGAAANTPTPTSSQAINNTGANSNNSIDNNGQAANQATINGTGPSSSNTIGGSNHNTFVTNNTNLITVANLVSGAANSGNAVVIGNTNAGNAASGNAIDQATIVNMLQSSSNALGKGNVVTFVKNIDGNVNGDLLFDPSTIGQVQGASSPSGNNNITFNNQTNANINNNVNLSANSGDVTVSGNNTAGDANSGSAEAIANVVNLINSAVGAGKSFVGTININGNLNGNILIPPSFIQQLVASNVPTVTITDTGPSSNNSVNNANSSTVNATNTNNEGITNKVNSSAGSGNASVSGNTIAGNASSGNAKTGITAFNLTNSNVIGANDLLVFVNVLGTWVGMIVNAPAGATAAELGGGISSISNTGPSSSNGITNNGSNMVNANNNNNLAINNNINIGAHSGNATETNNTKGGNARSGDAKTAVNLLNVQNSSFSLSNWFGVLFINVFGTWHGNFGSSPSSRTTMNSPLGSFSSATGTTTTTNGAPVPAQFFRFVPSSNAQSNHFAIAELPTSNDDNGPSATTTDSNGTVLAAHAVKTNSSVPSPALSSPHSSFGTIAGVIGGSTALYIALDALYTRRHASKV